MIAFVEKWKGKPRNNGSPWTSPKMFRLMVNVNSVT